MGRAAVDSSVRRRTGTRRTYDQACPVAYSLDLLGERWTLLIVRDLMFGAMRFSDLRDGLPGLAPNLLSERLRFLVDRGVAERIERPSRGSRNVYRLTERGRELAPVIHALARFGVEEWPDPDVDRPAQRLLRGALLALMTPERLDDSTWSASIELPEATIGLDVCAPGDARDPLDRLRLTQPGTQSASAGATPQDPPAPHTGVAPRGATITSTLGTLRDLRRGAITITRAESRNTFAYRGSEAVRVQLAALFGWARASPG